MSVFIRGAGVAGLALAHELAERDLRVTVAERAGHVGAGASGLAGGMLAPFCEAETGGASVLAGGRIAADWWEAAVPGSVTRHGTLVVALPGDQSELQRFASRTEGWQAVDAPAIATLEPALAGRFRHGLYYAGEAHLDPGAVLSALARRLEARGVQILRGVDPDFVPPGPAGIVADCTGAGALGRVSGLRGVRGERLILRPAGRNLSRPVRLLHPRWPLYAVPRPDGRLMIGATMIESPDDGPVSARSLLDLLAMATALDPVLGEARLLEASAGVRPALPDNLPRVLRQADGSVSLNGLYRHGFLLAPALARQAAALIAGDTEEVAA